MGYDSSAAGKPSSVLQSPQLNRSFKVVAGNNTHDSEQTVSPNGRN